MSNERKKGGVLPWIVALLIGLPVLYVASFGPVCWLYNWKDVGKSTIHVAYFPLVWISRQIRLEDLLAEYATGGKCPAVFPFIADDGDLRWGVNLPERDK